jgi:ferric-dicitrate binding protein FerR (iron transport regulator)
MSDALDQLIACHLDGELSQEQSLELDRLVRDDPVCRRRFAAALRQELLLGKVLPTLAAAKPVADIRPHGRRKPMGRKVSRTAPSRQPAFVMWGGLLAACLAVVVLVWQGRDTSRPTQPAIAPTPPEVALPAIVAVLDGSPAGLTVIRGGTVFPATARLALRDGDRLAATAAASAAIAYPDGSRLALPGACELALRTEDGAKRIDLAAGTVVGRVTPQGAGRPMRLVTPHAQASVLGTEFTLTVSAQATRLEVAHGRVGLLRLADRATVEVATGEFAVAATGTELAAKPLGLEPRGTGLKGDYFSDLYLAQFALTRLDPIIDFTWSENVPPAPGMRWQDYSIRWTGRLQPPTSESYTFHLVSDDGARLWLDGKLLIDSWTDHQNREDIATLALTAGRKYEFKLEYYQHDFGATIQLWWSRPSAPREIVPQGCLYPPEEP